MYKKSCGENGSSFKKGVLHRQTCVTGLSKSVTLLKSTLKLHSIMVVSALTRCVLLNSVYDLKITDEHAM